MNDVERWRAQCNPHDLPAIDALRAIAIEAGPHLIESIKWNAPSFAQDGEDCITLGLNPRGGYRVVLHRGAKAKAPPGLRFDDPDKLADWPSPDRGVIHFADPEEIEAKAEKLKTIFARWLEI